MAGSLSLVAVSGALSLSGPSAPVYVTTADDNRSKADSGDDPASTTSTTTSQTSIPGLDDALTPGPPTAVTTPGVGTVLTTPGTTPTPIYGSRHPLIKDPEGDARLEPGNGRSDPTLDVVHLDVTATTAMVTVELRMSDLTRQPLPSANGEQQREQLWGATLLRPEDGVYFWVSRSTHDDSTSVYAGYQRTLTQTDYGGTPSQTSINGVTTTVQLQSGVVKVLLPLDAINRAMAENQSPHAPFGIGTEVTPRGTTMVTFNQQEPSLVNATYEVDEVFASEPGFRYRLGD
jgi:hypothetical protein